MNRCAAWLLAAAVALPGAALAQSPYHVRVLPALQGGEKKDKEKEKDKGKLPDMEKPEDKGKLPDKPDTKEKPPAPPAVLPTRPAINPYPAPAPAIMDPRFMAWQQVYPGPGSPYPQTIATSHPVMAPIHTSAPIEVESAIPVVTPAAPVLPLPAGAPEALPAAPATPKAGVISIKKLEAAPAERTIDLVPTGGRGGWRVMEGPR